jgi:dihydrofolate reductase/thymidylate synthase
VLPAGVLVARSLEAALAALASPPHAAHVETVFVIGGAGVYASALASPLCEVVHLTEVDIPALDATDACDTHMPPLDAARFALWAAAPPQRAPNNAGRFTFLTYVARQPPAAPPPTLPPGVRGRHEESQYLDLIRHIIECGEERGDRTGTGTLSVFGAQMRFDLRRSFPLLTTKRVFWRGVAEELLWFISGATDARRLREKDIHIWDGNGSRAFLDANGLSHREEWDLGPVYGFQWRHFGAECVRHTHAKRVASRCRCACADALTRGAALRAGTRTCTRTTRARAWTNWLR